MEVARMHFSHSKDSRSRSGSPPVVPNSHSSSSPVSPSGPPLKHSPKGNENHLPHLPHFSHAISPLPLANGTGHPSPLPTPPPSGRRSSWFGFSSKFSSSSSGNGNADVQNGSLPQASSEPTKQPTGFLISTFRKLSSSGAPGRFGKGSSACATTDFKRVVLNRNSTRERCKISELDGRKLRKVAFCVDVEVAPATEDPEVVEARRLERRRRREQRAVEKEKEMQRDLPPEARSPNGIVLPTAGIAEQNGGHEKHEMLRNDKDRGTLKARPSDISTERTPRDDNMTPLLESEGTPIDSLQPHGAHSTHDGGARTPTTPNRRFNSRPTTDPAKIYKQCCQLRETHQLLIITEQLAKANGAAVLPLLDLSGHRFVRADSVALSDFLALVPVKKLVMEDCGLTDEMLRVVLCGLLSVKAPYTKEGMDDEKGGRFHSLSSKAGKRFNRGIVESLSFKNNSMVGRDGWRYISLFIHMSRTLKAIDLSGVMLPQPPSVHAPSHTVIQVGKTLSNPLDTTPIFSRALGERLVGHGLEEVALAHCSISSEQLQCILEGITRGGTKRLSLKGNNLTDDGLALVGRWIKNTEGAPTCQGLDLSDNNLQEHIDIISASLHESSPLAALCLSNCNLSPTSLSSLLPALTLLPCFKLLDLSDNPLLFSVQPDALPILRKHLPRLTALRKLQLVNTSMMPDHAIALSEILPDIPVLAHFDISGNPLLLPSGDTTAYEGDDEMNSGGSLEEGAAIFTALVAAVKVSKTIVRIDIDEPDPAAGDVIKALSRRVLAYCLRNMEAGACDDWTLDVPVGPSGGGGMVGTDDDDDDDYETGDHDDWKEEENYVVGGTGVVKALGVCLGNRPHLGRRLSSFSAGFPTLQRVETGGSLASFGGEEEGSERANEMSKSLLMRARKIKERIQPALKKAASGQVEEMHHRRLLFLDDTLYRVIKRYEEEYPECRLPLPATTEEEQFPSSSSETDALPSPSLELDDEVLATTNITTEITKPLLSRRSSQVSLASRNLENEEGQMHRFGHYIRKGVLRPQTHDVLHGVTGNEVDSAHIARVRRIVDEMAGEEIRRKVAHAGGVEKVIERLSVEGGIFGRVVGEEAENMTDEELKRVIRLECVMETNMHHHGSPPPPVIS